VKTYFNTPTAKAPFEPPPEMTSAVFFDVGMTDPPFHHGVIADGPLEYWSNGIMNSGIQGLGIRKFLNPIIPQFLSFTQYSILPLFR
jgi:hypothetical protein